ncbi:epoxide hydrolase family protein [Roseomonas sp. WA12]
MISMDHSRRSLARMVLAGGTSSAITGSASPAGAQPASREIRPFRISVADEAIKDLQARLDAVRWPERETVGDLSQGVPLDRMRALVDHWRHRYDWRDLERRLNAIPQFVTTIDGLDIHFLHIRSRHADALPLIMTHGWPGSIVELLKVIGPLTDPMAHGGEASDAFHLVLPSLPGYGFSGKPINAGWGRQRTARAWHGLMGRLGYDRYVAQGGDWGSVVTQEMGRQAPQGLAAIHVNMPAVIPRETPASLSPEEAAAMKSLQAFFDEGSGYAAVQRSRPQTIGYALADSPVGQAAWIYEKFIAWTDSGGVPERVLTRDEMLDDIMFYWITNSAASSARFYAENADLAFFVVGVEIPVGVTVFPGELYRAPRSWGEKAYPNLIYWNEVDRGGHFAAFEQPIVFSAEMRACFRAVRNKG